VQANSRPVEFPTYVPEIGVTAYGSPARAGRAPSARQATIESRLVTVTRAADGQLPGISGRHLPRSFRARGAGAASESKRTSLRTISAFLS
jgi:hypothetical protein